MPTYSGNLIGPNNPLGCLSDNIPAGMQGARHARYSLSLSEPRQNKFQSGTSLTPFPLLNRPATLPKAANDYVNCKRSSSENVSSLLTVAQSTETSKTSEEKKTGFTLFGRPILTEEQMSKRCSGDRVSPVRTGNSSSEGNQDKVAKFSDGSGSALHQQGLPEHSSWEGYKENHRETEPNWETGQCKVFMESEDVGRTLDLSLITSYDELCSKLAKMFTIEDVEMRKHVLYRDATGAVKLIGDEPFR